MNNFVSRLLPFIFLGIFIVLLICGLILLSYLLIAGAVVGLILFVIAFIRDLFIKKNKSYEKKRTSITIDHHDFKK